MARHIPSEKSLRERLWPALVNNVGFDRANASLKVLRNLLVAWRDGRVGSREMLEEANGLLFGHGIEYLKSRNGKAEAYYVNRGETYSVTLLLDTSKDRIYLTSWGDWLETEERQGNKFEGLGEWEGEFKSLNYGEMPSKSEFVKRTAGHYPYPMQLVGEDRRIVEDSDMLRMDGVETFRSPYPHKLGVRVLNAEAMHYFLTVLKNFYEDGDEDAGNLASSILYTLGYEWV